VCIPIEFEELDGRAQDCSGLFRLGGALGRCAVTCGFAPRADHKVRRAPRAGFGCDHASTPEFDIVGMGAKRQ
jgi:hypothetical protein